MNHKIGIARAARILRELTRDLPLSRESHGCRHADSPGRAGDVWLRHEITWVVVAMKHIWTRSSILIGALVATGVALAAWKVAAIADSAAAAASQPEPMESIVVAAATERSHTPATTAVGTVIARRSVTLRNELAGTVRRVNLAPGRIVEADTVLVALDVSVEQAELSAQQAQATLAATLYERARRLSERRAVSANELDEARAERDVALAEVARTRAIIERKMIRAPFRSRIGISDVHPGQYLNEGTVITSLQGVDDEAYVDFAVAQQVAAALPDGAAVDIFASGAPSPISGTVVATDARVDRDTRNATVRARVAAASAPAPGSAVRVQVPNGPQRLAVAVPVNALRKGPAGDHVFVVARDKQGNSRAYLRPVRAGALLGAEVLIESGIRPGEQVAASGSFKLRDAALVAIASEPPKVAGAPQVAAR
jgi:membrane fusion protein (multidrug efflux system)